MDVSPNALRKETVATLKRVESTIASLELEHGANVSVILMAPLLLARAQCLNTLAMLNERR
jgi:hypothetical protein